MLATLGIFRASSKSHAIGCSKSREFEYKEFGRNPSFRINLKFAYDLKVPKVLFCIVISHVVFFAVIPFPVGRFLLF